MKTYDELKALIERRGVHAEFGDAGDGWGIEQNPHELATFLVAMQELGVQSVLEIGTGYKGGLSRFLAQDMGWRVTTVDVVDYGHKFEGVEYVVIQSDEPIKLSTEVIHSGVEYDLLFIDGNHTFEQIHYDYVRYEHQATKAVAFHDILGKRGCLGAEFYWQMLSWDAKRDRLHTNYHETIEKVPHAAGIGWYTL